jgi:hypothetical protein
MEASLTKAKKLAPSFSRDTPELFQLVEEALDEIALAIDRLLPTQLGLPVGAVGNVGNAAVIADADADAVGVVALSAMTMAPCSMPSSSGSACATS